MSDPIQDEIEAALLECVVDGLMESSVDPANGELRYRLTPAGYAHVRQMIVDNAKEEG